MQLRSSYPTFPHSLSSACIVHSRSMHYQVFSALHGTHGDLTEEQRQDKLLDSSVKEATLEPTRCRRILTIS